MTVVEGDPKAFFSIGVGEGVTLYLGLIHFILDTYLIMLIVKQGGIKYHFFLSLWYDSTRDLTPVFRAIGEHFTNKLVMGQYIKS